MAQAPFAGHCPFFSRPQNVQKKQHLTQTSMLSIKKNGQPEKYEFHFKLGQGQWRQQPSFLLCGTWMKTFGYTHKKPTISKCQRYAYNFYFLFRNMSLYNAYQKAAMQTSPLRICQPPPKGEYFYLIFGLLHINNKHFAEQFYGTVINFFTIA